MGKRKIKSVHGLLIDGDAIGAGVYEMICEKGEDAHEVAVGIYNAASKAGRMVA